MIRAAVSPDGSQFAFTNGRDLWSFDTNGNWARSLAGQGSIADLGFSPEGKLLLAGKDARLLALEL